MKKANEGVCPMLDTDWSTRCNLSEKQIEAFCSLGCSPICAELFIKRWGKKLDNKKAAQERELLKRLRQKIDM